MTVGDYIDITNIRSVAASHERRLHGQDSLHAVIPQYPWEEWMEKGLTLDEYMDRCEREYLSRALEKYKTSYLTAKHLGTSQSSIMRRKTKYGL